MRSPVDRLPANAAFMARLQGFEPWTYGLEGRCSILLSYRRIQEFQSHILTRNGAPVNLFSKNPQKIFSTKPKTILLYPSVDAQMLYVTVWLVNWLFPRISSLAPLYS